MKISKFFSTIFLLICVSSVAQEDDPNWSAIEDETLKHFRALRY